MIKNLIFDFGKVLVDYDFEAFFHNSIPDTERCQTFTPVLFNEELQQLLDREERSFEVIMEEVIEKNKEFEPEIRFFNEHYPEIVTNEVEGMYELLTRLIAEGYFTKFNLKPEECVFADDKAVNIEGGKRLGMAGIVFTDAKQYERELREYLAFN